MSKVWVSESGEYEQRYVSFVASTPEDALSYVFKIHPEGEWVASPVETWGDESQYRRFSIKGKVYINSSAGNLATTAHEYELNEEEFVGDCERERCARIVELVRQEVDAMNEPGSVLRLTRVLGRIRSGE